MLDPIDNEIKIVQGPKLNPQSPNFKQKARVYLYGREAGGILPQIPLTDDIFSHHMFYLGSSGTGKTTVLRQAALQIRDSMTNDDVMLIFDPKGDFLDLKREIDVVIDNQTHLEEEGGKPTPYWNLFSEIDEKMTSEMMEMEFNEIASTFFAERISGARDPFFPNAGKDLLAGSMTAMMRDETNTPSNEKLRELLNSASPEMLRQKFSGHKDLRALSNYISGDNNNQTQGVMSELQQVSRTLFQGNFKKQGKLSIRQLVRERGKKIIFIEYDLLYGHLLGPIYRLLFDLALKEALRQGKKQGNVYFLLDEYRLMPNSPLLEIAANFGRSCGVRLLLGLQSISQLYVTCGSPAIAESLLSGLATQVIFHLNDIESRVYVANRLGRNEKWRSYLPTVNNNGRQDSFYHGYAVEDWDILALKRGEAIIALPEQEPFLFTFNKAW
jgi:type IV secretory pathway TraG/TraD family ATPase VirD4